MKTIIVKCLMLCFCFGILCNSADAQTKKKKRTVQKRTAQKTNNANTANSLNAVAVQDTTPPPVVIDSLPFPQVKKSLRSNTAVTGYNSKITDKVPLAYEDLRESDAVYRQKLWRDIDTREKLNLPFRYSADEDNGNQRFISILFKAIQDGDVTAFSSIDDRFTTPLTIAEVAKSVSGGSVTVPIFDTLGNVESYKTTTLEVNLDSFYKFRIKEEVIFDKESSRLFWRILGIAPIKSLITSEGVNLGETPIFWVYYPDLRPTFAKYEAFNGKNLGARMTWEELFELRMFYGRIVKSSMDNPYDQYLQNMQGLQDKSLRQLRAGEDIKNKIFNYEQNLWSY
ncbi:MAG: gliding motility protein GldN [Ginsengibacter sp.]